MRVRPITDEEVAFYEEHGWAKLERFVTPQTASLLLARARGLKQSASENPDPGRPEDHPDAGFQALKSRLKDAPRVGYYQTTTRVVETPNWRATWWGDGEMFSLWYVKDEPFRSLAVSKSVGEAVLRLSGLGKFTDKAPSVRGSWLTLQDKSKISRAASNIYFHQDWMGAVSQGQVSTMMIWIALEEMSGDQGTMCFLDKSHRAGFLGYDDVVARYPKLPDYFKETPSMTYRPGDATVHHPLTVHASPRNATSKSRWACMISASVEGFDYGAEKDPKWLEEHPIIYP